MAYRRGRSGLKGAGKIKRLLKALPDEVRTELADEFQRAAPAILAKAKSNTPRKTGKLQNALSFKVFPKSLRLRVGVLRARLRRDVFYGHILEVGRKAQMTKRRGPSGRWHAYHVKPISALKYDIVGPRTKAFARQLLRPVLNRAFTRALKKAARLSGGSDD